MRRSRFAVVALAGSFATAPVTALAQAPHRDTQFWMPGGPWTDLGWLAVSATTFAVGTFALDPPTNAPAPFDGYGHRTPDDAADVASTVLVAVASAGTLGSAWLADRYGLGLRGRAQLRGAFVLVEAEAMTFGLVAMLKNIGECRPRAWNDATQQCTGTVAGMPVREDRVAFPSGHTAPVAALAGASLGLLVFPSVRPRAWIPVASAAGALAIAVGVLRVAAGAHDWVDTGTGFGLGLAVGLGTAALHVREVPLHVGASADGVVVRGVF